MITEPVVPEKQTDGATEPTRNGQFYRPNVDIVEVADKLVVMADMPGVSSQDVDINFEGGALSILGRVSERQNSQGPYLQNEYGIGDYYRTFKISEQIDASKIAAELSNGVLTLHLPKVAAAQPRKIQVQSR